MSHLTYTDCLTIQVLLAEWYSHRWVARRLCRSNATISREIKKYTTNGTYNAKLARLQRRVKRTLINTLLHTSIKPGSALAEYILTHVKLYWSPEQIANTWSRRYPEQSVSTQTIYTFVESNHWWMRKKYFRRRWKKYVKSWAYKWTMYARTSIHERPPTTGIGHWEADTIQWKNHKGVIVTFNERESGYLLAYAANHKTASNVTEAAVCLFATIPKERRKTITMDNWTEFSEHYMLRALLGVETYHADVGAPWQRGANENLNGLLRQFYPKWKDLRGVDQEELQKYVDLLNNRPRKRLWRLSPIQYLELHHCVLLN